MKIIFSVLTFLISQVCSTREQRSIIFPASAQVQWISAFGIPMDIEESVYIGYRMTAYTYLPTKMDDLLPLYTWEGLERNRRDLKRNEKPTSEYDVGAVVIEEATNKNQELFEDGDSDDSAVDGMEDDVVEKDTKASESYWKRLQASENEQGQFRWHSYLVLEGITKRQGLGGKHCILRTICESATAPISHSSGIFGELLHILLTPSSSVDTIVTQKHQEYRDAESFGRIGHRTCEEEYPECTTSLMDIFSSFNNPFESLFKTYS